VTTVHLISFPKCGRTWLRLMIGKALIDHYGLKGANPVRLREAGRLLFEVHHDGDPHLERPDGIGTDKSYYRADRVIFLVRDPRDVMVSLFFHRTRRDPRDPVPDTLPAFIDSNSGGLGSLIAFYNAWARGRRQPAGFLLVRYEDIHRDAIGELRRVLGFMGVRVAEETMQQAVDFASFENMRHYERANALEAPELAPANVGDDESYKVRRGLVGGYVDYLDAETIERMNRRINAELDDYFDYYKEAGADGKAQG